ncbi:MAG: adenylyl-sulfate kinase [Nanoarchaeota archaeon]
MKGYTIWFTGLSGSGKTTIANKLADILRKRGKSLVVLDGDIVRKTLSADLGYTKGERDKHITRIVHACELITKNHVINIACVISPTRHIRKYAKDLIGKDNFIEVYVKCPLEVCEKRDVKGHYAKVRSGEIEHFVGINVPYEEPLNPDLVLETDKESVTESANKLIDEMVSRKII